VSHNPKNEKRAFIYLLLLLFVALLFLFKPFLMPIILATVLAVLFYPLYSTLLKVTRNRPYIASFLSTFSMTAFLFVPATLMASLVTHQLIGMVSSINNFIEQDALNKQVDQWSGYFQNLLGQVEQTFQIQVNLRGMATNAVKNLAVYVYQYSPSVVTQTFSFFLQAFIMLVVVFFLFVEGKKLYREFILISPLKDEHENELAAEMKGMIYAVVYGSFFTALVQCFLATLAFYFLGVPGFLVWGALTFLLAFVPIVGAAGVWIPATLILFISGHTTQAIILALYGTLIISGIDNVLKPLLIRGRSNLHPVILFLAIMGGLQWVGPLGILLGPVLVAVFLAALKIYKKDYRYPFTQSLSEPLEVIEGPNP